MDDFVTRLVRDERIKQHFKDTNVANLKASLTDQICQLSGGPCVYKGRDMKTSHAGLGITGAEWDAGVKHLVATLDKFKVPMKEKDDLLAAASGLKKDIVEK